MTELTSMTCEELIAWMRAGFWNSRWLRTMDEESVTYSFPSLKNLRSEYAGTPETASQAAKILCVLWPAESFIERMNMGMISSIPNASLRGTPFIFL